MVAVAAIWVKAPARTQGQNIAGGVGGVSPVATATPIKNTMAKGKPNRNRTWVAPTVPSVAVSSRCMALRAVCAAAAISVKTAQSIGATVLQCWRKRVKSDRHPGRAKREPGSVLRSLSRGHGVLGPRFRGDDRRSRRRRLDFRRLGKLRDLAVLVIDQQEQVEITDGGGGPGAPDDRLAPFLVVRALGRLDRRPDIDAGAGPAVELEQEVLAQQFLVRPPLRNDIAGLFGHLRPAPALRRIELHQFHDHAASP